MSTELTIGKHSISEIMKLGEMLAKSGYFKDATDPAKAVAKIMAGQELGIPPFASMAGIYIIEGKPVLGANLIAGLIKKSGKYDFRVLLLTNEECDIEFYRDGKPLGRCGYDMDDAERAGLAGKAVWKRHPRNMMFARSMSDGAKHYCPDIFITGVYVDGADFDAVAPVEEIKKEYVDIPAESVDTEPLHEMPADLKKMMAKVGADEKALDIKCKNAFPAEHEAWKLARFYAEKDGQWEQARDCLDKLIIRIEEVKESESETKEKAVLHSPKESFLPGVEEAAHLNGIDCEDAFPEGEGN